MSTDARVDVIRFNVAKQTSPLQTMHDSIKPIHFGTILRSRQGPSSLCPNNSHPHPACQPAKGGRPQNLGWLWIFFFHLSPKMNTFQTSWKERVVESPMLPDEKWMRLGLLLATKRVCLLILSDLLVDPRVIPFRHRLTHRDIVTA
jgi:hypothetical protein